MPSHEIVYRKIQVCTEDSPFSPGEAGVSIKGQDFVGSLDMPTKKGIIFRHFCRISSTQSAQEAGELIASYVEGFKIPVIEFQKPKHELDENVLDGFIKGLRMARGLDCEE